MKIWLKVFFWGFLFNLIWEQLHSFLYVSYQGGPITFFILLRAAIFDAAVILVLIWLLRQLPRSWQSLWLLLAFSLVVSIGIEWWALNTDRWVYKASMPIVPLINTGLTPTIQLGFLALLVYYVVFVWMVKK